MTTAEIIAIGTELLLGEIQDTNTKYLARLLRNHGINLYRTTMIGDNASRIADVIKESLSRAQIVITTGGLGPTIDDPTREAVALAANVPLEFHAELWEQILARFQRYGRPATENNKRQAYIPAHAIPIENPVGTAPSFIMEFPPDRAVISLPGVPKEMEFLMEHAILPYLRQHYQLHEIIKARVLHTVGIGESFVDNLIGNLETLSNPTVGLLAHPGQVDIRITAKADTEPQADAMINSIAQEIYQILGEYIYGEDGLTLINLLCEQIQQKNLKLNLQVHGIAEIPLSSTTCDEIQITYHTKPLPISAANSDLHTLESSTQNMLLGIVNLFPGEQMQKLFIQIRYNEIIEEFTASYGGHRQNAPSWALMMCLDRIRKFLSKINKMDQTCEVT